MSSPILIKTLSVIIPYPPSANEIWGYGQKKVYNVPKYKKFKTAVKWALSEAQARDFTKAEEYFVKIELFPSDWRRRDDDNIVKPTFDAITASGLVWNDDSQVIDHRVIRGLPAVKPFAVVHIIDARFNYRPSPTLYGVEEKQPQKNRTKKNK